MSAARETFGEALAALDRWRGASDHAAVAPFFGSAWSQPAPFRQKARGPGLSLRPGVPTAAESTERALAAIERRNGELNAFVEVFTGEARRRAAEIDAGNDKGPLAGVTVSVKDLFSVRGSRTRAGSAAFERVDSADSSLVLRLREAGAVLLGKTTTHEFAMGVIGPQSRNPHDPSRIAGGSSTGAAIAVASGMGRAALGTDTRGSIRIPAAFCGVIGFKPTPGLLPLDGVVPLSWSIDTAGVIAATVEETAAVFGAIGGDPRSGPGCLRGLRIGRPDAAFAELDPEVLAAVDAALATANVVSVSDPSAELLELGNLVSIVVSRCEAAAFHRALGLDRERYSDDVRQQLAAAADATADDYIDAQRLRAQLGEQLAGAFERVDLLAMPTTPITAPRIDATEGVSLRLTRNVALWSFVGFPAISLPCRTSGLPIGLQLVAPPGADDLLLAAAAAFETA